MCLGLLQSFAWGAEMGFADVSEGDWFAPYVDVCVEDGLMKGTGEGKFSPEKTLTMAEAAAIAARLGEQLNGGQVPQAGEGLPWYSGYVEYLKGYGAAVERPEEEATRQGFFALLAAVTPASVLVPINSITSLPDTDDAGVLGFYNAGILTGTDSFGTFSPAGSLTRAEVAAMMARVLEPELRVEFTPVEDAVAMTVDGEPILKVLLESCVENAIYYNDLYLYQNYGTRLTWGQDYGVGDLETYLMDSAQQLAVQIGVEQVRAKAMGILAEELEDTLVPQPDEAALRAYVQSRDLLCAKHILVNDPDTAQAVLNGLDQTPTPEQFNALMLVFGQDPGVGSNPDGYLFTAGEMIQEFETAVRGLGLNTYTDEAVQSQFGYHIIWRLDPLSHPQLVEKYRQESYNALVEQWMAGAQVTVDQAVVESIDVKGIYDRYVERDGEVKG